MGQNSQSISQNRKARFHYEIVESFEAGLVLTGTEVKSIRQGRINIMDAHAGEIATSPGELYLFNLNVLPYSNSAPFGHEAKRPRKLLLKRRQIVRMVNNIRKKGMTIVPLSMYFNAKGRIKIELALAKGKTTVDKRQTIAERDWQRQKARVLKGHSND